VRVLGGRKGGVNVLKIDFAKRRRGIIGGCKELRPFGKGSPCKHMRREDTKVSIQCFRGGGNQWRINRSKMTHAGTEEGGAKQRKLSNERKTPETFPGASPMGGKEKAFLQEQG